MKKKKKLLVIGGAGYCGHIVVPILLKAGWKITIYDSFWFGNYFKKHKNLKIIKGDVRDFKKFKDSCKNIDAILHLACISNDASFELDKKLSTSINLNSFERIIKISKEAGVKRFVFASSSSVYGISRKKNVKENHPLVPLTLYNKYKGFCETKLLKHTDKNFVGVIFRPATVCGYSPRLRLDLSVNILTNHAINKNKILVFGGKQLRPNLHILDYARVCKLLLSANNNKIADQIFNVGMENLSILQIAKIVKKQVTKFFHKKTDLPIEIKKTKDLRSYHINSDKIKKILKFKPRFSVKDAVIELCNAFKDGKIKNSFSDTKYYNVRTIKKLKIR